MSSYVSKGFFTLDELDSLSNSVTAIEDSLKDFVYYNGNTLTFDNTQIYTAKAVISAKDKAKVTIPFKGFNAVPVVTATIESKEGYFVSILAVTADKVDMMLFKGGSSGSTDKTAEYINVIAIGSSAT
jgi:hypothetical protein